MTDLHKEYDAYFDDCERANKIPLCFDKWRELLAPDIPERAHNHD